MLKATNRFNDLKSKIRELHIPLPNFKYFHKPSSEEEVFRNFIGREEISEQLEDWLTNGDSGAYLVTGYRGMGKSSFVGKVLNKITSQPNFFFTFCCLLFIISFVLFVFTLSLDKFFLSHFFETPISKSYKLGCPKYWNEWILSIFLLSGIAIILIRLYDSVRKLRHKIKRWRKNIEETDYKAHKTWFEKVFGIKDIKESKHNIVIKLNLGHETLKEKDILSLITKRIHSKYKEYLDSFYTNWIRLIGKNILFFGGAILIVWFLGTINITSVVTNITVTKLSGLTSYLFKVIQNFIIMVDSNDTAKMVIKVALTVIFYFVVKRFYDFIGYRIPSLRKHSTKAILEQLKSLIDRIESSVTESSGPNTGYTSATSVFSFNFSRRKNKTYPYASTREIEDELIQILQKIQVERSIRRLIKKALERIFRYRIEIYKPLKFIIVFDELDKIDPVYNQVIKTEQEVPEFETGSDFQGNSPIRNRKQNVLKLLGNMKLFMSQAKAKFVFISGRELYDAYLADLADREFAASSIFNGVIYVDSFLDSSSKEKNILTKTEEYICGYLIPKKWYRKEAQNKYYLEKGKINPQDEPKNEEEIKRQKLENFIYREPNLRMYKDFLIKKMISGYFEKELKENLKEENIKFASYKEFINSDSAEIQYIINLRKNKLPEIEQVFLFVDKVIVFLNQFSFYLTHVCNGSPKKITLYLEQYVKFFISNHKRNFFRYLHLKWDKTPEYCLSFDANDQQKIGFIYYIAYPITQTIINKTSHFGDKMLVSTSFLIDHIFKHHKGGFSYEDIEHTPELLEVYHIPNIRDAIDAIFSFLRQNIVTDICGGVYQYKFRKSIADEIKYNSHVSEEISAIFNFTLDESLPVKRHYYKQIKDNEKKYFAIEESVEGKLVKNQYAITLASQLEVLAEIHLLDDEYNEAIQYYQTAFEIIKSELRCCEKVEDKDSKVKDNDKLHLHVLLNHTVLKLGLAKEFKGAYNEALVIYNTLLDYLVKFRYLDEKLLGLEYFYEDNLLNSGNTGEWKIKKIKLYHKIIKESETIKDYYAEDKFYKAEVLPFYREMDTIKNKKIDFLLDGDYTLSGLSKVLSPDKQEIISRITLFSEVKFIYQVILANLFVVEKIDLNGITQENLDLAEDQFKYMYLLTDSKDKFIQAADFYKKIASILFLKNYSNPKANEYLKMWGFDIYETINEFCFLSSKKHPYIQKTYSNRIDNKYPKEILWEFFVGNDGHNLWEIFINKKNIDLIKQNIKTIRGNLLNIPEIKKIVSVQKQELIVDFVLFGIKKWQNFFQKEDLEKCRECYQICIIRRKNHPCYACSYVSNSLRIFIKVFTPKYEELLNIERSKTPYQKGKSYLFKLLEYFKRTPTNSNYFFVLASSLRIKADISLSCVNDNDNELSRDTFLKPFLHFLENYYDYQHGNRDLDNIDNFIIKYIENGHFSKLEKTILFYWLAAEYFHLNTSPIDSSECLTKILLIFDNYITIKKERRIFDCQNFDNPFENDSDIFYKIRNTIVRRVLRNTNVTNDDVNYIELQNLKHILRNRPTMRINLSNLSTTASIEEVLFAYCKLELDSIDIKDGKETVYFDCYQSTLLSPNRLSSTIQGKILSLEFKAKMNMAIFEDIFEETFKEKNLNFYASDFQLRYFLFLTNYFPTCNIDTKYNIDTKIQTLHFLIGDSLYCLTQIIEILSSGKFSKFSHSFMGDIYHQISQWATLYQLTYQILPQYSDNKIDIKVFIDKEFKTMQRRHKDIEGKDISSEVFDLFSNNVRGIRKVFEDLKPNITNKAFETNILDDIGTGNRRFLVPNYSIAMALRHYRKAKEVHSEGKEYKEMIKKMFIIDDDISNGMHNFSLALERYTLNCGLIEEKMEFLRKYYKGSLSFPLKNYFKDTSMD